MALYTTLIKYSFCQQHLSRLPLILLFDVFSLFNTFSGFGTGFDPRGKRWFNPEKQAEVYDGKRVFRDLWLSSSAEKSLRP